MSTETSAAAMDESPRTTVVPRWARGKDNFSPVADPVDWPAWQQHLANRTSPLPLQSLVSGKKAAPLAWALFPDETLDLRTVPLLEKLGQIASGRMAPKADIAAELERWLSDVERRIAERNLVLEQLAWVHALPRLAGKVDETLWWRTLDRLLSHAQDAAATRFENQIFEQALAGELPLTLAYLFPELTACRSLQGPANQVLEEGMQALTDGEGLPKVDRLLYLRPLLACWTRSLAMLQELGHSRNDDAFTQYQWLVRHALRLMRADGTQTLASGISGTYNKHLFQTALELGEDDEDETIGELVLPKSKSQPSDLHLPLPSYESAWSQFAYLRPSWQRQSPRLAVRHDLEPLIVELESRGDVLLSGAWQTSITVDAENLSPTGAWEQVGWLADDDGDYLELEQAWTEGARLQRLLFLAREDQFLWAMDSVLLENSADKIIYQSQPPLGSGVQVTGADETHEAFLQAAPGKASQSKVTVLPVGLNEWRSETSRGTFGHQEGKLTLRQVGTGLGMVAPLFFDLARKRQGKQLTWRQATVAEKLEILSRDKAAAFRIQIGDGHWVFYRSLTPKANRTFLGVNLISETLIARLDHEGNIEKLLEVEAS